MIAIHAAICRPRVWKRASGSLLRLWLLCISLAACSSSAPSAPAADSALGSILGSHPHSSRSASASGRVLGVAIDTRALSTDPHYFELVEKTFGSLTPENAMKLDSLAPSADVIRCGQQRGLGCVQSPADNVPPPRLELQIEPLRPLLRFATEKKRRLRGHPIVWFRQIPTWLLALDPESLRWFYDAYLETVTSTFSPQVAAWDVVNEAILQSGFFRPSLWFDAFGPEHIEQAFRVAAREVAKTESEAKPQLYYNDFDLAINERKLRAVLWMLDSLREFGVPVDGVGFQMHLRPKATPSKEQLLRAFAMVAEHDFDIEITELDVALPLPPTKDSLAAQANTVCMVVSTCLATERCRGITVWGLTDSHSWIPHILPGLGAATLFDQDYRPKPAYYALVNALHGEECIGN